MRALMLSVLVVLSGVLAGCGSSSPSSTPTGTTGQTTTTSTPTAATPSALRAEAASAATGDIPDNQVFLTFRDSAAGYSIKYPEGWAQQGSGSAITFHDKNNIVRIVVRKGAAADPASVRRELAALAGVTIERAPQQLTISGVPVVKVAYTTSSPPNPVTGKRVTLVVDRYYLAHAGERAVIDLGTPKGVDNVDAYRLMIQSFRWR